MTRAPATVRFVTLCAAACAGFAFAGCQKTAAPEAEAEVSPVAVSVTKARRGDMEETLAAQGALAPRQGGLVRVAAPFAGRLQSVLVREGDAVVAGQTLAVMDNRAQGAQAQSAAATLRAARSGVRQAQIAARASAGDQESGLRVARTALAAALADQTGAIQSAQGALDLARTDVAKTNAGARPQEVAQAQGAVKQAEATRARAETEAKRQRFLFDKGVSARRQVDDAETALVLAVSGVESAAQNLDLVRAGARPEDRTALLLRVRQAEQALKQARIGGAARIAQARALVRQAEQARLQVAVKNEEARAAQDNSAKAGADLAAAQTLAGYGVLRSPLSGVVTRRSQNPGDMADPATPFLDVTDTRSLDLTANLAASDGARVRPGMRALVSLVDTPGEPPAAARVESVGQVDPQTNLLAIRLRVPNGRGRFRIGAFAQANIVVRTVRQAVLVPKEAIITRDGKSVVFVVAKNGIAHETAVTTGPERNGQTAIGGAVHAGDTVIRLGQYELEDGGKVTVAKTP